MFYPVNITRVFEKASKITKNSYVLNFLTLKSPQVDRPSPIYHRAVILRHFFYNFLSTWLGRRINTALDELIVSRHMLRRLMIGGHRKSFCFDVGESRKVGFVLCWQFSAINFESRRYILVQIQNTYCTYEFNRIWKRNCV